LKQKSIEAAGGARSSEIEGADEDGLPLSLRMDDYDNDGKITMHLFTIYSRILLIYLSLR